MRVNFHMHSTGSDGKNTPEEMIKESIKEKLTHVCLTDHFRRANKDPWSSKFFSEDYINEINLLRSKYRGKIDISFGAEVDWFEDCEEIIREELKRYKFDFILGSVHFIKNSKGESFLISEREQFKKNVIETNIKETIKNYYSQLRKLTKSDFFDSIAHFDLVKIFNKNKKLFNEIDSFYITEVLNTLDEIAKNKKCIEINTSGLVYDCEDIFPSLWILKEARKRGIPITIGTDAHRVERITDGIDKAYEIAKEAGYKSIFIFKNRKPIEVKI